MSAALFVRQPELPDMLLPTAHKYVAALIHSCQFHPTPLYAM